MTGFVVQSPGGQVLAVFTDQPTAETYAAARLGRTVAPTPLITTALTMTMVHTRWLAVDADGAICTDDHDSYGWCAEVDGEEGTPPLAEVEEYADGPRRRILGVGTDADLLADRLLGALRKSGQRA